MQQLSRLLVVRENLDFIMSVLPSDAQVYQIAYDWNIAVLAKRFLHVLFWIYFMSISKILGSTLTYQD